MTTYRPTPRPASLAAAVLCIVGIGAVARAAAPLQESPAARVTTAAKAAVQAVRTVTHAAPPIDLAPPDPSQRSAPVPSVSAYKSELADIAAKQREIMKLTNESRVTALTLQIDNNLRKIQKDEAALNGIPSSGAAVAATAAPGKKNTVVENTAPTAAPRHGLDHPMEIVDLGGSDGRNTASIYVGGVGLLAVHVGSYLPGHLKVASISLAGITLKMPDGSTRLIGLGSEVGGGQGESFAAHETHVVSRQRPVGANIN